MKSQDDLIYNTIADLTGGTNLILHVVYTYDPTTGKILTKELYDNAGTTKNNKYEKYTSNAAGTLLEKIYFFDGSSLGGTETGTPDSKWHKSSNFTAILGDGGIHSQNDLVYNNYTDALNGTSVGLLQHNTYTYFADGKINTKEVLDNIGATKDNNYEKYFYNDDSSSSLNTKVFFFDGTSLSGTETGTPDSKWHRSSNFTGTLGDGLIHSQDDLIYNNYTDTLNGTSTGLLHHDIYTLFADGKTSTKEVFDSTGTTKNNNYEKYIYNDDVTSTLNTKIFFFDGISLTGSETGTPDNDWHRAFNYSAALGDGQIHSQSDYLYGNYTDALAGTGSGMIKRYNYTFFSSGNVHKKDIYTGTIDSTWSETYWYHDASKRLAEKLLSTGEAAIYFDAGQTSSADYKLDTYWSTSGTITHWASVADYDTVNNCKTDWYMPNSTTIEAYTYYASGNVQYKDVYVYNGSTWVYQNLFGQPDRSSQYNDNGNAAGGSPFGTWLKFTPTATRAVPTIPTKPVQADVGPLSLQAGLMPVVDPTLVSTGDQATVDATLTVNSLKTDQTQTNGNYTYSGDLATSAVSQNNLKPASGK